MIRPTQLFKISIAAVIGRCQGVISSGVSPGVKLLRSAINSSAISSFAGSTFSAAIPISLAVAPLNMGFFFFKEAPMLRFFKKENTGFLRTPYLVLLAYFKVSACALPKAAFDACEPAQNGTAMSAKSFCDCHTSAKNSFSAAFFSRRFFAAAM